MIFDLRIYNQILEQPEGMSHKEYRKAVGRYVSTLTDEQREDVLSRREEILEAEVEWRLLNRDVLLLLGFDDAEAGALMDKRLDSPGMRMLIRRRADEIRRSAKAVDIVRSTR